MRQKAGTNIHKIRIIKKFKIKHYAANIISRMLSQIYTVFYV